MPVQQDIAKPPIPRIIHEHRLQKRFQCRDDDGQWRVTEADNGKTTVWFYGGKEQLKPPGTQSWSSKPHQRSRQDKARDAKQVFPDPTEPDHPETIIGQLKAGYGAGYGASKNKQIERWIKDVERYRLEEQGKVAESGNASPNKWLQKRRNAGTHLPVNAIRNVGSVGVTNDNSFGAFPKSLETSQAYRTVQTRQKRPADQTLMPSKRINLGKGTLEDPILID